MAERLRCSYISSEVELTDERERHITERHPDLLPANRQLIGRTLKDPDVVRRSGRFPQAWLLSRWYDDLRGGKHVVVVVAAQPGEPTRYWLVTAYMASRLAEGTIEWQRS